MVLNLVIKKCLSENSDILKRFEDLESDIWGENILDRVKSEWRSLEVENILGPSEKWTPLPKKSNIAGVEWIKGIIIGNFRFCISFDSFGKL